VKWILGILFLIFAILKIKQPNSEAVSGELSHSFSRETVVSRELTSRKMATSEDSLPKAVVKSASANDDISIERFSAFRKAWIEGGKASWRNLVENEFEQEFFWNKFMDDEPNRIDLEIKKRLRVLGSEGRCFVSDSSLEIGGQSISIKASVSFTYRTDIKDEKESNFRNSLPARAQIQLQVGSMGSERGIYELRREKHGDKEFLIFDFSEFTKPEAKLISLVALEFPSSISSVSELRVAGPRSIAWSNFKAGPWLRKWSAMERDQFSQYAHDIQDSCSMPDAHSDQ
jgi:hypothetical protein